MMLNKQQYLKIDNYRNFTHNIGKKFEDYTLK